MSNRKWGRPVALLACALGVAACTAAAARAGFAPGTQFYVPKADHGAIAQIADLTSSRDKAEAVLLKKMIDTPQAVWLTGGTSAEVERSVRATTDRATDKGTVPVFVAYDIPWRDCSQYSAGGAASVADYEHWIDGVAAGIGSRAAVVLLEPDGLGIIPWYNPFGDRDAWASNPNYERCRPAGADPATAAADRFAALNYAVDRLKSNAATRVYLDSTHSAWLGAGDAADRLLQAGVQRADGFFLNVSNFELNARLVKYGTWVSMCIAFAGNPASWGKTHTEWCASQYSPASPDDFSTWTLSDQWYADNVESQTWWYTPAVLQHFVIDTSRNGHGPWTAPAGHPAGDPETWCNPPDRGLGEPPTADTGVPLVDAYLWVKTPGQSDGQCHRWTAGPADPVRGLVDPAAGAWFPQLALELVRNASPALP